MRDLSIIITACNEGVALPLTMAACIEEVDGNCDWEMLIVDNLSNLNTDHIRAVADCREKPPDMADRIRYLRYEARQSHWAAKNYGIELAMGRNLYFIDAHAIPGRGSIGYQMACVNGYCAMPAALAAVHAAIRWIGDNGWRPKDWTMDPKTWKTAFVDSPPRERPEAVAMAGICGMLCRRELFTKYGYFPDTLGVYGGGEQWLSERDLRAGRPHYIHPRAWVWHPLFRQRHYPMAPDEADRSIEAAKAALGGAHEFN